jgi:hypothetical protein
VWAGSAACRDDSYRHLALTSCIRFSRSFSSSRTKQRTVSSSIPSTTGTALVGRAPWLCSCFASFSTCGGKLIRPLVGFKAEHGVPPRTAFRSAGAETCRWTSLRARSTQQGQQGGADGGGIAAAQRAYAPTQRGFDDKTKGKKNYARAAAHQEGSLPRNGGWAAHARTVLCTMPQSDVPYLKLRHACGFGEV